MKLWCVTGSLFCRSTSAMVGNQTFSIGGWASLPHSWCNIFQMKQNKIITNHLLPLCLPRKPVFCVCVCVSTLVIQLVWLSILFSFCNFYYFHNFYCLLQFLLFFHLPESNMYMLQKIRKPRKVSVKYNHSQSKHTENICRCVYFHNCLNPT